MAEFVFNLDQLKSSVGKFESGLYSKTKDEDLKYTGNDYIIWDRTNAERIRRGLPSLSETGYARPPEDTTSVPATGSAPTNPDGTAKTFALKGPPGFTREQAFAIFKKQADTGSLVGFTPGETLSAATQAADGLPSAQAALAQAQSGTTGSLGAFASNLSSSGVNLSTGRIPSVDSAFAKGGINGGAGALGGVIGSVAAGLGASGGALGGSLAGIAPGLTAMVGPAVSAFTGALGGKTGSSLGTALTGASGAQGSVAVTAIQTINKNITASAVTSPINIADFSKMTSGAGALAPIGPMSVPEVNGVLAQAKNLTGQGFYDLSDTKGLGAFGLNVGQLETAGYVKPGSSAKFGLSALSDVVKSPAVWTGKDGIKSVGDLLGNAGKQSQIQQDLMTKGVVGMGAVGIPIDKLSSQGIAGMSLNAAKSLPDAEAFAKGLPIPGDATGAVQAEFSSAVRDGAFAVNLVNTKIPTAFKQQDVPKPAADTVGRATVDAASNRVLGDDKIPTPDYSGSYYALSSEQRTQALSTYQAALKELVTLILKTKTAFDSVYQKINALTNQQTITQQQYDAVAEEKAQARKGLFESGIQQLIDTASNEWNKLSLEAQMNVDPSYKFSIVNKELQKIANNNIALGQLLTDVLKPKIEGPGESA
jgi:hypothetical protein